MANITVLLSEAKVDSLHRMTSNGRQKYLCFTNVKDSKYWSVEVTDGVDVWFTDLDEDGIEAQRDLSGVTSLDAFLAKFRNGFLSGDISVARVGTKVTLSVGRGDAAIEFDLFEAKAAEKKSELQFILFRLAQSCSTLEDQLSTANHQIDVLKAQKPSGAGGMNPLFDLSPKKGAGQNKPKPKKVGMSVINPSSRKRKAATGVIFEGE